MHSRIFFAKIPLKWWAIYLDCSPWTGSFSNLRILPAEKIKFPFPSLHRFRCCRCTVACRNHARRNILYCTKLSTSARLEGGKVPHFNLDCVGFLSSERGQRHGQRHTRSQRSTHHHRRLLLLGDRPPARPAPSSFVRSGSQWKRLHEWSWVRVVALAEVSSEALTCAITLGRMANTRWMACDWISN